MAWWQRWQRRRKASTRSQPPIQEKPVRQTETPSGRANEFTAELAQPVPLEVTDVLDLHTFAPREIPQVVETYLQEARAKGYSSVRIIHGKGTGTQRARVRSVLQQTPFVASFGDAPAEAGSWGATVVWFA